MKAKTGRKATPQQILSIREDFDAGELDTRAWADALGCSIETVRRIARRETCREVKGGQRIAGVHEAGKVAELAQEPMSEAAAASLARMREELGRSGHETVGESALEEFLRIRPGK
jgi:hypothetical protein